MLAVDGCVKEAVKDVVKTSSCIGVIVIEYCYWDVVLQYETKPEVKIGNDPDKSWE